MRRRTPQGHKSQDSDNVRSQQPIKIIGGTLRGRKLAYSGEFRTRPMKERVREAVFNLIADDIEGKHAIDLFAGTGALGLEAVSRGAAGATLIEQHFPTAELIGDNIRSLGLEDRCQVIAANTFIWGRQEQQPSDVPWTVFCSPPYSFYVERKDAIVQLLAALIDRSPPASIFVVESDTDFANKELPLSGGWDVRSYPPAQIAIYRKPAIDV